MTTEKSKPEPVKREEPERKPPPLKVVALRLRYRLEDTNPGD
jgi:hypothetical protein